MDSFFGMGGYAGFVWSAYAVFFIVLAIDTIAPMLQRRRALKDLQGRMRREMSRRNTDRH
jgi:heme exporter protein D